MMRIRSPQDFWSGLFFIAVALGFIALSYRYGLGDMHNMGSGLFPVLVSVLLGGLGLLITIRSFAIDGPPVPRLYARPIGVGMAAIVLFGVVLKNFGLVFAVASLVVLAAFASSESRVWETGALIVGLVLFSVGVFVWLLGLPIPLWSGP